MTLHTGEILDGKYRIIRELGSGAMGAVYEGENVRIRRRVAIKVLHPGIAQKTSVVRRFEQEAQAAGRIGSDHIVEVLDLGTMHDGGFYMVMEFLEGETLSERIKRNGRLAPKDVSPIAQQLLFGLEMAHEARIVHRDLKPDNVFLVREHLGQKDFVKILDFGISKFNPLAGDDGMSMTKTGTVMGTPFYMAPEQAKGSRDVDHRSDIYSVGVILYEAVTGQVPFHAGTFNELIFKIVLEAPPPPETYVPDLDPAFSRIIRRAMARDISERFQAASDFRETLSLWLHTGRDEKDGNVTPPPLAASDEWSGAVRGARGDDADGKATVVQEPAAPARQGTHLMEPDDDGGATRVVDEDSEDIGTTRVADGNAIEPATRMVDASPLSRGKPKPPPPPRRKSAAPGADAGAVKATVPLPAVPARDAPAATVAFEPGMVPPGAAPMGAAPMPMAPPRAGGLAPNAATPVTNRAFVEEDVWPVAGVPKSSNRVGAIIAACVGVLVIGTGLAVWLLGTDEDPTAHTTEETAPADGASEEPEEVPAEPDEEEPEEPDEDEAPDEAEPDEADADEATAEPVAEAPPPPPPPPAPKPVALPTPKPAPQPTPPPPPPPAKPSPKPAPKPSSGRQIQTEL